MPTTAEPYASKHADGGKRPWLMVRRLLYAPGKKKNTVSTEHSPQSLRDGLSDPAPISAPSQKSRSGISWMG